MDRLVQQGREILWFQLWRKWQFGFERNATALPTSNNNSMRHSRAQREILIKIVDRALSRGLLDKFDVKSLANRNVDWSLSAPEGMATVTCVPEDQPSSAVVKELLG
jgi:hypothetical protein